VETFKWSILAQAYFLHDMASVHMGQIFAKCTKSGNAACIILPFKVDVSVTLEYCQKGLD